MPQPIFSRAESKSPALMGFLTPASAPVFYAASIALSGASSTHTPKIAMTAHVMKGDRTTLSSKGMDGFFGKPASRKQVLASVNKWLGAAASDAKEDKTTAEPLAIDVDDELLQEAALVQRGEDTYVSMLPN